MAPLVHCLIRESPPMSLQYCLRQESPYAPTILPMVGSWMIRNQQPTGSCLEEGECMLVLLRQSASPPITLPASLHPASLHPAPCTLHPAPLQYSAGSRLKERDGARKIVLQQPSFRVRQLFLAQPFRLGLGYSVEVTRVH